MKNLGNIVSALGMLLFIYSVVGRFVDKTTIGLGIIKASSSAGMITASCIMLVGMIVNQWKK